MKVKRLHKLSAYPQNGPTRSSKKLSGNSRQRRLLRRAKERHDG
jgi:hypothetical protein